MVNVDFPRGLQPHEHVIHKVEMKIPAAYAQDLFVWDPVIAIATGRDINIATAGTGNPILGSILAISA